VNEWIVCISPSISADWLRPKRIEDRVVLQDLCAEALTLSGRYDGQAVVRLLDDGRRVQLVEDFGFIDQAENRWDVPEGAIVDGASIPQALWSIIGGPFEGRYRDASIVHDWYCDMRSRPWQNVHRVFFEAMLTSGVAKVRANLMYAGVYWGGPRWSETVTRNMMLASESLVKMALKERVFLDPSTYGEGLRGKTRPYFVKSLKVYRYPLATSDLSRIEKITADENADLSAIEKFVDSQTVSLEPETLGTYAP
jgi:hypothetical protein